MSRTDFITYIAAVGLGVFTLGPLFFTACQAKRPATVPAGDLFPFGDESAEYREGFQRGFLDGLEWSEAMADSHKTTKP